MNKLEQRRIDTIQLIIRLNAKNLGPEENGLKYRLPNCDIWIFKDYFIVSFGKVEERKLIQYFTHSLLLYYKGLKTEEDFEILEKTLVYATESKFYDELKKEQTRRKNKKKIDSLISFITDELKVLKVEYDERFKTTDYTTEHNKVTISHDSFSIWFNNTTNHLSFSYKLNKKDTEKLYQILKSQNGYETYLEVARVVY